MRTIATKSSASSTSGTSASSHPAATRLDDTPPSTTCCADSGVTARLLGAEQTHPSELRKLTLVRVEHELARIPERRLDDGALSLAQHDCVGRLGLRERGAGPEYVEEHAVNVQAVHEVELGDVHEIDAHQTSDRHANRVVHVRV